MNLASIGPLRCGESQAAWRLLEDGVLDTCGIAAGAADAHADSIPDSCQRLADSDGNGVVSVNDLFLFLQGWFDRSDSGDFNNDHHWSPDDIFGFLAAYFTGCPV